MYTDNSIVVTREEGGWERLNRVRGKISIHGDKRRLNFGDEHTM